MATPESFTEILATRVNKEAVVATQKGQEYLNLGLSMVGKIKRDFERSFDRFDRSYPYLQGAPTSVKLLDAYYRLQHSRKLT
jgi:hypothetical protein